jgi:hypothetical protein
MGVQLGNILITKAYLGTTLIADAYLGSIRAGFTPPDTIAPTIGTLSSVTRTNTTTATLTWTAASDNTGVTGYKVYRSQMGVDSGFTLLKTIGAVLTTTDTSISQFDDTYFYYVTALDAKPNESGQSNHLQVAARSATNIFNTKNTISNAINVLTSGNDANSLTGITTGRFTNMTIESVDVQDGIYAMKLVSSDAVNVQQYRTSRHSVTAGNEYVIRFWAKASQAGKSSVETANGYDYSSTSITTSWVYYSIRVFGASTTFGVLNYYTAYNTIDGTEQLLVDGVKIFELN